ncbi:hypothetical protein Tel_01455 [Candidatus Tenderia electrophaga]|jgi:hypothetical protein|uniref:Thioredoxin domain-containing protein n=1 Tax=Candidatus Tenderia electrophaga TaxID=1748243 RepID=A0A0S2T9U9_9GAMM|nr:hypothetical protein Tel_01455 [Candidatus Tenderia electrophaga]
MVRVVGGQDIKAKQLWALSLVAGWLVFTAVAFWWFQLKDVRPFAPSSENRAVFFRADALLQRLGSLVEDAPTGRITVVHFWDPDCACSRFSDAHVAELIQAYGSRGVAFIVVPRAVAARDEARRRAVELFGAPVTVAAMDDLAMPSSPAAAVLDAAGRLVYFGPYSNGAVCGAGGDAFVEKALDKALAGDTAQVLNMAAVGCFCDWNHRG